MDPVTDVLTFFVLVLEVATLTYTDRRIYGRWVTPFNLLAVPYLTVVIIIVTVGPLADLYPLQFASLWVWIVGLAVFWGCGSIPVYLAFGRNLHEPLTPLEGETFDKVRLYAVSMLCIAASAYGLVKSGVASGLTTLSSSEFRESYQSGWTAHARVLSYCLIMFLVGTKNYARAEGAILFGALFVFVALGTGKSWMIIPLFSGLTYQVVTQRMRLAARTALLTGALFFALFCAAYLIRFASDDLEAIGDFQVYEFLGRHFLTYLSAGVMALSERFALSGATIVSADWRVVFAPFVNLWSLLTGNPLIDGVTDYWISTGIESSSNVHTLFGTLYIHLGPAGGLLYVFGLSLAVNGVYAFAIVKRNCWILLAALFEMSLLAFGWFDNYSGNLMFIEVPAWALLLMAVARLKVKGTATGIANETT
jgi:oligosaccharide repeat unit polymerase